jgi:hypothetical protein
LFEELLYPFFVLRNIRIQLAVGSFQVRIGYDSRAPMTRAGNVYDVEILLLDDAVEMNIDEVQSRRRAPVTQQSRFDVISLERFFQKRVVIELDLTDRQIIRGVPIRVDFFKQLWCERFFRNSVHNED